jgi:serine phosphatase RsbU (regulator of sigma subunit)
MKDIIYLLTKKVRPDLETMSGQQRISGSADVLTLLYSLPLVIIGVAWLILVSDWESVIQSWYLYLLMGGLFFIFNRLRFYFITEIRAGGYANSDGAMDGIVVWAAILLLGPTFLWVKIISNLVTLLRTILRERTSQVYWNRGRMFCTDVASDLLPTMAALAVYTWAGGSIPIKDYSIISLLPALLAIIIQYIGTILVYSGYIVYVVWSLKNALHSPTRPVITFFFMALTLPALANPFGVLAAGIYANEGLWEFLYVIVGLLIAAFMAKKLSYTAEYSRQQTRQIDQLEKLSQAILDEPPDGTNLALVLRKYVSSMFASQGIHIWTESMGVLLQEPLTFSYDQESAWAWLQGKTEAYMVMPGDKIPWNPGISYRQPVVLCSIRDVNSGNLIGEIFIELQNMAVTWDIHSVRRQLPVVQSLSAQIASALHRADVYQETLSMEKTMQELALARTIQTSFLPETVPSLPGWQISAILEPARQVAGDFYDFIHLPDGKLGILIADVADKGLGSALYMALSCTLIRTFANQYYNDPALILKAANQNILRNARANLFVTVFFAILDPITGMLCYANAGHNPPYLIGIDIGIVTLNNTGMPLGVDEGNTWGQDEVRIAPGEMLVMYTDGVTDAQNSDEEFIDRKVITNVVQQNIGKSVYEVQQGILDRVHNFVADAPRFDDLTLVILGRENNQK